MIVYVVGDFLLCFYMEYFIIWNWNNVVKFKFFLHKEGYFIVKFELMKDRDDVIMVGLFIMNNKFLIMKVWWSDFCFKDELVRFLFLWMKLFNLFFNCWSFDCLNRIISCLGIFLMEIDVIQVISEEVFVKNFLRRSFI